MHVPRPDVSVIIAAYNAMPYLTRCVTSAVEQSIGPDRLEVIAVDDGSTDGTGEELDRLADTYGPLLTVLHQENSGGPSAPRNAGIELARGRYVFFLDADDHLGPEAMERMVAAAEENGSDVVLGRMVGEGGRTAPGSMFRRTLARTDVHHSRVYWTLNPLKLFRRELVDRLSLRFPTDLSVGEDQPFTALAYLHAAAISVVADYDCVYWVARGDGGNITSAPGGTDSRLRSLSTMFALLAEHTEAGPQRDALLCRHFAVDMREALHHLADEPDEVERKEAFGRFQDLVEQWYGDGVASRLRAFDRLRFHLVRHGRLGELLTLLRHERARGTTSYGITLPRSGEAEALTTLVEDGRVHARYPFFRDPQAPLPDGLFDITDEVRPRHRLEVYTAQDGTFRLSGHAFLEQVGTGSPSTALVLRRRGGTTEFRIPTAHTATPGLRDSQDPLDGCDYGLAGFEAVLDPAVAADGAPLDEGLWDLHLDIGSEGVTRRVRLGRTRGAHVPTAPATQLVRTPGPALLPVTGYFTVPHGNLSLDVGENKHTVLPQVGVDGVAWREDGRPALVVAGTCALTSLPAGALALRGTETATGAVRDVPAVLTGRRFAAEFPVTGLRGTWSFTLRLGDGGYCWPVPVATGPGTGGLGVARWKERGWSWYAKPTAAGDADAADDARAAVRIERFRPLRGIARRLQRS